MAAISEARTDTVITISIDIDDRQKSKRCIFRAPNVPRRQKPEDYTPNDVSIGPFHCRQKHRKEEATRGIHEKDFEPIERVKEMYLKEILAGMKNITLEDLTAKVTELSRQKKQREGTFTGYCNSCFFDKIARSFYAEPLDEIAEEDFIKMMIVDGCFLRQLFRKRNNYKLRDLEDLVLNMDVCYKAIVQ